MIKGHGDDAYQYPQDIRADFSSNICCQDINHEGLMAHLAGLPLLVAHYPEPEAWSLEQRLASRLGIRPDCVIVTSGATEAIYLVAQTFRMRAEIPTPTFSEYADACQMYPATDHTSTVLWLCNPCNPTGAVVDKDLIDRYTQKYSMVILDQSYENYTHRPVLSAQAAVKAGNVVQIHSMTKTYAVPGIRLGYITAAAPLVQRIKRWLRPWSVSSLAIEAGHYLLEHDELICTPDLDETQRLFNMLNQMPGISVMPTECNFMLCQLTGTPHRTAAQLKHYLAHRHGLLIRDAANFKGLSPQHFRVATQQPWANDALVHGIGEFIVKSS